MTDYRSFGIRTASGATIIDIKQKNLSEFDFQEQLRDELTEFVSSNPPGQLIVNLTGVDMIGSNAIGVLVDLRKTVHANSGTLALAELSSTVRMSLQVLNLEGTLFNVFETEAEALNSFD